jgi:hypothetical protein
MVPTEVRPCPWHRAVSTIRDVRARRGTFGLVSLMALAMVTLLVAGCGGIKTPPLGLVEGTVTLDGVPLPSAMVVFTPDGQGRSSTAVTDSGGRYSLSFLRDIPGANVGPHTVRITTATGKRGVREMLPTRYHRRTVLVATVQPGSNTIDFALQRK